MPPCLLTGGRINSARFPELYLANADGSAPRNLTRHPGEDTDGAWSPDGRRIVFVSNRSGNDDLYTMDADGANVRPLTSDPVRETSPCWSPRGMRIAFCSVPGAPDAVEIYAVDVDGSNRENLTKNTDFDADPVWSPDGKQLLFTSQRGGAGYQLYVMDADGSNVRPVPAIRDGETGMTFPTWTPDKDRILLADAADGALELFRYDLAGQNRTQLTRLKGFNMYPTSSPDGKQVAFYHWDDETKPGALWVTDSAGTSQSQLTDEIGPFFFGRPSWQPR